MSFSLRRSTTRKAASIVGALALAAVGCSHAAPPRQPGAEPSTSSQQAAGERRAPKPDVVVRDAQSPVVMHVGQTLGTPPPLSDSQWQVDYDHQTFQLVYPSESDIAMPGPAGWVWKAIRSGQAEITLTQVVSRSSAGSPPNVVRVSFQVEVRPR